MNMKYYKYVMIVMLALMAGCNKFDPFLVTEKPYVDQTSVQLYVGEHAGSRNTIQLKSSPEGRTYQWTSQDPSVATVTQSGVLTAVSEGITTVTVASADDQIVVDVNVKEFIPLTDFTLSTNSVIGFWQDKTQVFVTYTPANATEVNIEWSSSNHGIAEVYNNGLIKTLEEGRATVTAKFGDITHSVDVWVPSPPVKMSKANWKFPGFNPNSDDGTIGYSSQQRNDGGGIAAIIDESLSTFWHARYGGAGSNYPHWFIIDLGEEVTIAQVGMGRRTGDSRGQKGYQVFTCLADGAVDLTNPNTWNWQDQGDIPFDASKDGIQIQPLSAFPTARYVKVFIADKFRGSNNYAMVSDFSVYIFQD